MGLNQLFFVLLACYTKSQHLKIETVSYFITYRISTKHVQSQLCRHSDSNGILKDDRHTAVFKQTDRARLVTDKLNVFERIAFGVGNKDST